MENYKLLFFVTIVLLRARVTTPFTKQIKSSHEIMEHSNMYQEVNKSPCEKWEKESNSSDSALVHIGISHETRGVLSGSFIASSVNKQLHTQHGNIRRIGYRVVSWNCGRGLLLGTEAESPKFVDIKCYIEKHDPHLFSVIECDLHGPETRLDGGSQ